MMRMRRSRLIDEHSNCASISFTVNHALATHSRYSAHVGCLHVIRVKAQHLSQQSGKMLRLSQDSPSETLDWR
jgi:hypothetical protein